MTFLWLKAFHIIAVVTWFAAIFYLPRLFVYHADASDEISRERFKVMERKLYRGIMTPSMVVVIALGIWMLSMNTSFYFSQGWMHAKLTLVALLVVYHFYCGHLLKVFKEDRNTRSHVFYRWFNEVPVFILLGVVILVVVRPF
ncbi:protoporphyrinogen oxidase HemJ [Thalassolituus sp.]|jgi:putative membrane protein|uniref:protoporphyrinogen oxidase HemJ n=1 Tax=Thalassolituus sp. TaxID=2030822 RepID=UPI002439377E|nr:protoporphyrinogen oxidase HemJ [Thalassolituus sp.]MEC9254532.1 protoporphyrinogen oxidase HemJ [Pseudomonadota bacterium]MEC9409821.1 protoporphyrinogen oxidase HemJ [Pseudomonadota bacterium]MED5442272.1 protoporphyrinogen oxidase HemJ [Pseudomonadota bacterium]MEE3210201.1 protoporphyrinogen oxidase HemJ [Pseudomonadota bacterium]|tara:strand:+ start:29 stop:457 length:429 start_codon:yes stop_codon:yes gene_type:complete